MLRGLRLLLAGLLLLTGASYVIASAAAVAVPASSAHTSTQGQGANDVKPSECAALSLGGVVTGSGAINGGATSELIAGSAGVDVIDGGAGDDCILGGAGDDTLIGGDGTDVCIGGGDPGEVFDPTCETTHP